MMWGSVLDRNSRYNILNAAYAAASLNMIGPFVRKMAIDMGADNLQLGYLASWPNAASVIAVMGAAAAVARVRDRKRLVAAIFLLGRAAALGVAAVPWLPPHLRVWGVILFWVLAVFPNSAATTALNAFLADVFHGTERGRALAERQSWSTGVGMVVAFATGWLLDDLLPYPYGYLVFFTLSFLVGLIEIYYFLRMDASEHGESPARGATSGGGLRSYLTVFTHKPFTRFLIASVLFHFTWQMVWPLFDRFQITELGASNMWLGILTVSNSIVAIATYPLWTRWAQQYGTTKVLGVAAAVLASAPALNAVTPNLYVLVVVTLFTGTGVAGVMLLVLNTLLEVSPAEGRPLYLAVHSAVTSVGAAIAPLVGAYMMTLMPLRTGLAISTLLRMIGVAGFLIVAALGARKGNLDAAENSPR